jgi:hypothetical protein
MEGKEIEEVEEVKGDSREARMKQVADGREAKSMFTGHDTKDYRSCQYIK